MSNRNLAYILGAVLIVLAIVIGFSLSGSEEAANNQTSNNSTNSAANTSTTPEPDNEQAPTNQANQLRTISLFYYNTNQDKTNGCDANAVLPVERRIEITRTPIQDAINLLIKGDLQAAEEAAGFTTEFPNKDFRLLGANLDRGGVLTLEFTEVSGFTSGGSCRVTLLANQIIKTAKQFPGVNEVKFKPEELFQP
jgi:spore germination protein GerM